jgi:hypothetical protein
MRQIEQTTRKTATLTFAKLTLPGEPLEAKSAEEMTEVCLADSSSRTTSSRADQRWSVLRIDPRATLER